MYCSCRAIAASERRVGSAQCGERVWQAEIAQRESGGQRVRRYSPAGKQFRFEILQAHSADFKVSRKSVQSVQSVKPAGMPSRYWLHLAA
eukprot:360056-Chlamydomonas_euryale.AAC.12